MQYSREEDMQIAISETSGRKKACARVTEGTAVHHAIFPIISGEFRKTLANNGKKG